jgi:hypothetical protein
VDSTIIGTFDTRRNAELAVEHVVQECDVTRENVFIQPVSSANSAGRQQAPMQRYRQSLKGSRSSKVNARFPWICEASTL